MSGQGVWADLLRQRLRKAAARLGLNDDQARPALDVTQFRRPAGPKAPAQSELF
jgi:hypothetical protein